MKKEREENLKIKSSRWDYIDLIEALIMLFTILYHSTTYDYSILENPTSIVVHMRYFFQSILSVCMPLFFFVNGYLLFNRSFDLKKHIIKSIKIIILTFVWALIGVICIAKIKGVPLSFIDILQNIWNWQPIGWINYMWYMGALICVYVFFPLLKSVFDHNRKIFIYFTIIATILTLGNTLINHVATLVLNSLGRAQIVYSLNWFNMFNPFRGMHGFVFVYFCIGGLAHQYKDKILCINSKKRNLIALCVIIVNCSIFCAVGVSFSHAFSEQWEMAWNGMDTFTSLINVLALYVLSLNYNKHVKIFRLISMNTLGIFFVHNIFINLLRPVFIRNQFICTFTGCLLFSIMILLLSLACTLVLKKVPLIKNLVSI